MKESNWSTGTSTRGAVVSHFHKLQEILDQTVKAVNVAQAGATSNNLDEQVTELIKHNPDYVTLLIGGNDVCSWPVNHEERLKQFTHEIETTIQKLISHNPEVKILLVPVPDMKHLWELNANGSCQWLWDLFDICPSLLSSSSSESDRTKFKGRLDDLNKSLEFIALMFKDHVRFDADLANYKFKQEDISKKDCFHPSLIGQNNISELTWKNSWYTYYLSLK